MSIQNDIEKLKRVTKLADKYEVNALGNTPEDTARMYKMSVSEARRIHDTFDLAVKYDFTTNSSLTAYEYVSPKTGKIVRGRM